MYWLRITQGEGWGRLFPLNSGVTLIGRDPDCVVHLESRKVSKKHAQIEVLDDGARVLDLHSTNGTRVGERSAVEPILLVDGDIIEVGEFQFLFLQDESKVLEVQDASQVRMTARAEIHAEEKLRAVLSIAFEMGGTIDLDGVLAKAFDCLFRIFPSAERGFVLLENGGQIKARASKVRHGGAPAPIFSRTVFQNVVERDVGLLCKDAGADTRFARASSVVFSRLRSMICAAARLGGPSRRRSSKSTRPTIPANLRVETSPC